MKNLKKIFLILVIMLGSFTMAGCGSKEKIDTNVKKIMGKWLNEEETSSIIYEFNKDKTGKRTTILGEVKIEEEFTYEVDESKITVIFEPEVNMFETEYKVKNKELTIKDVFNEDAVYIKQ